MTKTDKCFTVLENVYKNQWAQGHKEIKVNQRQFPLSNIKQSSVIFLKVSSLIKTFLAEPCNLCVVFWQMQPLLSDLKYAAALLLKDQETKTVTKQHQ